MGDETTDLPALGPKVELGPKEVGRRLKRLERVFWDGESGKAKVGRIKLMFDVLDAIANGKVADPVGTAAVIARRIGLDDLLTSSDGASGSVNQALAQTEADEESVSPFSNSVSIPAENEFDRLFRGIQDVQSGARIFENAKTIAERIRLDPAMLDFLYANSRYGSLSRHEWEQEVRVACAIETIMKKFFGGPSLDEVANLVDQEARAEAFEKLNSPAGTLVLVFHGGFIKAGQKLFAQAYPVHLADSTLFGQGGMIRASGFDGPDRSLFAALRSLQSGGSVFVAIDGQNGRLTECLNVLGISVPAAGGPAFLAHTSRCNTVWYTVTRTDDRFTPIAEFGPTWKEGESFRDFKDRFYQFCSGMIETMFTSDPRNIVLRRHWTSRIKNHLKRSRVVEAA